MNYGPERWRQSFQENGFIVVRDLLDSSGLSTLSRRIEEITGNPEKLPAHLQEKIFLEREHVRNNPQWYEGVITPQDCGAAVRQIADLQLFDSAFSKLLEYEPLSRVLNV